MIFSIVRMISTTFSLGQAIVNSVYALRDALAQRIQSCAFEVLLRVEGFFGQSAKSTSLYKRVTVQGTVSIIRKSVTTVEKRTMILATRKQITTRLELTAMQESTEVIVAGKKTSPSRVGFNKNVGVILVPKRAEYRKAGIEGDLWLDVGTLGKNYPHKKEAVADYVVFKGQAKISSLELPSEKE